jgi:hypothetical protein
VDPWIAQHGELQGMVIHAKGFPGWENLGGLVQHFHFLQGHHDKIKRVAVAMDGYLPSLMAKIGDQFVHAEIKAFHYDQIEEAIDWVKRSHLHRLDIWAPPRREFPGF